MTAPVVVTDVNGPAAAIDQRRSPAALLTVVVLPLGRVNVQVDDWAEIVSWCAKFAVVVTVGPVAFTVLVATVRTKATVERVPSAVLVLLIDSRAMYGMSVSRLNDTSHGATAVG